MKGQTLIVGQIQQVDISDLRIASWNARKTFDPAGIQELKSSIEAHGIQVPLIIRVVSGSCEIVAGHRRFHAALALWEKGNEQFDRLPCIVRDLDDDQAREIGIIDNLQREDVPAIEEADAFNELLQRLGSIAAVGSKVGKEQAYVAKRLKLCTLTTWSREALREKLITIDHALLLARLAADEQNAALKWTLDRNAGSKTKVEEVLKSRLEKRNLPDDEDDDTTDQAVERVRWRRAWEPETVLRLKEHIECESGIPLDRAPWDLELDDLGVGPCSECEKNTKANAPLFGDLETGVAICTDGACFKGKTSAFVRIKARMSDGTQTPLNVSWKSTSTPPRFEKVDICKCGSGKNCSSAAFEGCRGVPKVEQIFKYGQWIDVGPKSKKCEFTRPAVTVDWSDVNNRGFMGRKETLRKPGEVLQVCIEPKCKLHKKAYGGTKASASEGGGRRNENSELARAEREKWEAEAKAENVSRFALIGKALNGVKKMPGEILRRLLVQVCSGAWEAEEYFPGIEKTLKTKPVDSAEFARAAASLVFAGDSDGSEFLVNQWNREDIATGRKELVAILKTLGYDASKAWEKPAEPKKQKRSAKKPAKKAAKKKAGRK
jgi:ParB family chromosome partitioning protein